MSRFPFAAVVVSASAFSQPAAWVLDLQATELAVKVSKTGAGASLAHDHVVVATKFNGKGSLDDSGTPQSLSLELVVETTSLVPDEPEARRKYSLPNTPVPPGDRKKVKEHMLGEDQLDAVKYPTITFVVSRVVSVEGGALKCAGQLTLHGVTKELAFPIRVNRSDRQFEADASVRFKTSDFGIRPYSAVLGLIRNKDEVELVVHVVLKR